ncbi:MAG TPA: hypothetical protein VFA81_11040 [Burkholderiales bacterium]|nr:hypothetical protein [Burkholderiales bacterium]
MSNVRLQLELPEARVKQLEALMHECGMDTKKELFNTALTLFEWVIGERKKGRIIASVDEENSRYKELDIPAFAALKQHQLSKLSSLS